MKPKSLSLLNHNISPPVRGESAADCRVSRSSTPTGRRSSVRACHAADHAEYGADRRIRAPHRRAPRRAVGIECPLECGVCFVVGWGGCGCFRGCLSRVLGGAVGCGPLPALCLGFCPVGAYARMVPLLVLWMMTSPSVTLGGVLRIRSSFSSRTHSEATRVDSLAWVGV